MAMENTRAQQLIKKYLSGTCTPEEQAILESWYQQNLPEAQPDAGPEDYDQIQQEIWTNIKAQTAQPAIRRHWPRIAAAAIVLLCLSLGLYFIRKPGAGPDSLQSARNILPGSSQATLHMGNGRQILLAGQRNGELIKGTMGSITKTAAGAIAYTAAATAGDEQAVVFDTLTVPVAGTYHLILADGSKVWLNAATSVRYPERFVGKDRVVELLYGEAYFDVVHHADRPFRVISAGQITEDIGTQFNINAYPDETGIRTTLVSGAIRVSAHGGSKLIRPGDQSIFSKGDLNVSGVDTEMATAWKNGYFRFNNEHIEGIMRLLSRWYNIKVTYQGPVSSEGFYGKISRSKNISEVLEMLSNTKKVHFKIQGREVAVFR